MVRFQLASTLYKSLEKGGLNRGRVAVDRVRRTALRIARTLEPQPDLLVVELAALFHDLDGEPRVLHSRIGDGY